MAVSKTEVSTSIRPDIPNWIDSDVKEQILEEVGRYVVTEAVLHLGDGMSPVDGHGAFKLLSEAYADEEKGGDTNPNLELNGDMLGAYTWRVEMDEVKVGIFDKNQAIKAYGHNTGMKGHKWLDGKAPVRRLVPDKGEAFNKDIQEGIDDIVSSYVDQYIEEREDEKEQEARQSTGTGGKSNYMNEVVRDWLNEEDEDW